MAHFYIERIIKYSILTESILQTIKLTNQIYLYVNPIVYISMTLVGFLGSYLKISPKIANIIVLQVPVAFKSIVMLLPRASILVTGSIG